MPRRYLVAVIPGDGVGPEVISAAVRLLEMTGRVETMIVEAGADYYRRTGRPYEPDMVDRLRSADAVLKGPLDTLPGRYRSITVMIRRELDLYANIRPFEGYPGVSPRSFRLAIVRENTEGLYVGIEGVHGGQAVSLRIISERATRRLARRALEYAISQGYSRVIVVHKATVLQASDGLWLRVFMETARGVGEDLRVEDMLVDTAAYWLAKSPERLEAVIAAPNMYGDILSDVAAAQTGSLGLCASMQVGDQYAMFEPVHGTARDIAGKGVANPLAALKAAQYLLDYLARRHGDKGLAEIADRVARAVREVIVADRLLTPDLGGTASTSMVVEAVLRRVYGAG